MISLLSKVILGKIPSPFNLIDIYDLEVFSSIYRSANYSNIPALYGLNKAVNSIYSPLLRTPLFGVILKILSSKNLEQSIYHLSF